MKKILFFLLCLCLSFSCLGCTSNFKSVIPNNSSKTPAQTTQTTTKKPEKIKKTLDFTQTHMEKF